MTTLREIEVNLPNGFHDALLEEVTVSLVSKSVSMAMQIWVGDLDSEAEEEREAYKKATVRLNGIVYIVLDPPGADQEFSRWSAARIDGGEVTSDPASVSPKPRCVLPVGAFAYWFFVEPWNSFIHVAALSASIEWEGLGLTDPK